MLEIYNENVFDLLDPKNNQKLDVHEKPGDGFYVKGISTYDMSSAKDCMELLKRGSKSRHTDSTDMNKTSSRSHCIFSISIETSSIDDKGNQ